MRRHWSCVLILSVIEDIGENKAFCRCRGYSACSLDVRFLPSVLWPTVRIRHRGRMSGDRELGGQADLKSRPYLQAPGCGGSKVWPFALEVLLCQPYLLRSISSVPTWAGCSGPTCPSPW